MHGAQKMIDPGKGWVTHITLEPPSLKDNSADGDRLCRALAKEFNVGRVEAALPPVRQLPALLREHRYSLRCLVFKDHERAQLIHATAGNDQSKIAGLAVDLGTSRVVIRLIDLEARQTLGESSFDNRQAAVGPDVLARIHHADEPHGVEQLQRMAVKAVNAGAEDLCRKNNLSLENIHLFCVAGNTAMSHLFAGLPVHWMIREPYIPAVNRFGVVPAAELGLLAASNAHVVILPNVGSYFGGDLISGILDTGLHEQEETSILVDVGTNAEVVLGNRDWLMACAGAAGPALEGGMSRMGTTAAPGVIDRVRIDPQTRQFDLHTIDDLPPTGICGSGVIDLAAQLFRAGMIDIRGKLLAEACADHLSMDNQMARLTIVPQSRSGTGSDLRISQADLDSLVRSKAAMYTILETITAAMGLSLNDLQTFFVAGTFGSLIDPRSAITIGMMPDLPLGRYRSMGNTSLGGAVRVLTERDAMDQIENIREKITYLELNVNQDFMNRFSAAKFIPHTDKSKFPSC